MPMELLTSQIGGRSIRSARYVCRPVSQSRSLSQKYVFGGKLIFCRRAANINFGRRSTIIACSAATSKARVHFSVGGHLILLRSVHGVCSDVQSGQCSACTAR